MDYTRAGQGFETKLMSVEEIDPLRSQPSVVLRERMPKGDGSSQLGESTVIAVRKTVSRALYCLAREMQRDA